MDIDTRLTRQAYVNINFVLAMRRLPVILLTTSFFLIAIALIVLGVPVIGILILAWMLVTFIVTAFQMRKAARKESNSKWFLPHHYRLSGEEFIVTTVEGEACSDWGSFLKWRKVLGHYLLFSSAVSFCAIYGKDIPDKGAFESLLTEKLGKKR